MKSHKYRSVLVIVIIHSLFIFCPIWQRVHYGKWEVSFEWTNLIEFIPSELNNIQSHSSVEQCWNYVYHYHLQTVALVLIIATFDILAFYSLLSPRRRKPENPPGK